MPMIVRNLWRVPVSGFSYTPDPDTPAADGYPAGCYAEEPWPLLGALHEWLQGLDETGVLGCILGLSSVQCYGIRYNGADRRPVFRSTFLREKCDAWEHRLSAGWAAKIGEPVRLYRAYALPVDVTGLERRPVRVVNRYRETIVDGVPCSGRADVLEPAGEWETQPTQRSNGPEVYEATLPWWTP